ncbi:helix-turn-helix transcriptional regulator [Candidatus Woesearchaeota archaeon]|nr:helix-turn-helix transcriptional regulator [Candidatus Woesearchaeota archaeon]
MYSHSCPVNSAVKVLDSRWAYPLLVELRKRPASFGSLRKALKPITNKVLSATLRSAQKAGMVLLQDRAYSIAGEGNRVVDALKQFSTTDKCASCTGSGVCLTHSS